VAWGGKPAPTPHSYLLNRVWRRKGSGTAGNWPTVDSYSYTNALDQYAIAGKSHYDVTWYRERTWCSQYGAHTHIPADTIVAASVTMPSSLAVAVALENFATLNVYLAPDGGGPTAKATYDVEGLPFLGSITQAECVGGAVIPLDIAILNAHPGEDFAVVFATNVEAAGDPLEPVLGKASIAHWYATSSVPVATLTY